MRCSSIRQRLGGGDSHAFRRLAHPIPRVCRNVPKSNQCSILQQIALAANTEVTASTTNTVHPGSTENSGDKSYTYFPSRLPPTEYKSTRCETIKRDVGLWVLQQDFPVSGPAGINVNCVVSQLADGSLLVCSPVAPTPQCLALLRQLPGTVQHILIPSCSPEHFYYTAALAEHYPEANIWIPPGLFESKLPGLDDVLKPLRSNSRVRVITDEAYQQQLGSEIQYSLFDGGFGFQEATLFLKAQKAVVFSDLAFAAMNDEGMPMPLNKAIGKLVGIYKRLGSPIGFLVMSVNKAAAQQWVTPILNWDFDTVCGGHLTAAIANGKQEFERCFRFLLGPATASNSNGQHR